MTPQTIWTQKHSAHDASNSCVRRSDEFLKTISGYRDVLIIAHNNPDPDAIATGWSILELVKRCTSMRVRLVAGGRITRAENRHMVECLQAPIQLVDQPQFDASTAIVLVDCGVEATHRLATDSQRRPTAVIDHHVSNTRQLVEFSDVRPSVAASASIAADYLRQQGITPPQNLATALLYALKTETKGGENHFTELDRSILTWLTQYGDPGTLASIDDAPLSRDYYAQVMLAMQNTTLYGSTAFCMLPRAEGSEIVGEVADLLIRCEGVSSVLCAASVDADVLVSTRTACDLNATDLVLSTLDKIGSGGGHQHRAGGKISGVCLGDRVPEEIAEELRSRWLRATGMSEAKGALLIPGALAVGS